MFEGPTDDGLGNIHHRSATLEQRPSEEKIQAKEFVVRRQKKRNVNELKFQEFLSRMKQDIDKKKAKEPKILPIDT